ncbi:MAG TPA: glycosyltransferase N-terminal domain-containing protein [Bacteroidales bacterium]|nr:glycosyltransferase N-terminal domain-containing protein [Bacteroidales bacterium]HSA44294.1 glycosyltransferase N-terminal domain-containing protein [Bacteroidales bacterium]
MRWLYTIIISLYGLGIRAASPFNHKAALWVKGRKKSVVPARHFTVDQRVAWFHCASLGEFEQGRPVLEAFKDEHPDYRILLTFFSPSGYEIRKNYDRADLVTYLPLDTPGKMKAFLDAFHPAIVFFVKYEFWFNCLYILRNRKIPVIVLSAHFRPSQHFFRAYGGWFRKQLRQLTHFFVQDEVSWQLLQSIGVKDVTISGDTRFDRVGSIAGQPGRFPGISPWGSGKSVILAGSTWPQDESLLFPLFRKLAGGSRFIIAPHEVDNERIMQIHKDCGLKSQSLSVFLQNPDPGADLLVVDSIGQLSGLYRYAGIAYIGGGFGKGIHNILEAATFGIPVVFGPKFGKFREARELAAAGGAYPIRDRESLEEVMNRLLNNESLRAESGNTARDYVEKNLGATRLILSGIKKYLQ